MDGEITFLGRPARFWIELKAKLELDNPGHEELIQEIADLRARVSFYESRLDQMESFRKSSKNKE